MIKKPNIRFKGFSDDWEQRKLGELLSFLKDGTHGTHADADDGPLLLSAKNIKNGEIYWDETDRRISYDEYEKIHSNFSLESGDVLLTIVGSIGETAILKDSEGVTFQRSVAFLRPNNKITSDFLYSEIQVPTFQKELDSRKSTSAQPGIYLGDLAEIPVTFTAKIDEQKKIGEYFRIIDHLITLHQRKCDKLKELKKHMLKKMFPKNNEKFPEYRFDGFTDPWEQRKLSEVAEIVGGGTPSTNIPEYWDGDIDWYAPAEINDQIYVDGSERKITKLGLEKSSAKILPADKTVLFTSRAGIGKTAILRRLGATNQGFQSMVLNDETNPYFVYSMSKFIKEEAERVASGSTFAEVSGKMLGNLAFMFPTKKEQDKIGAYFSTLDHLITLHQRKVDNLKILKKFMLKKMFV